MFHCHRRGPGPGCPGVGDRHSGHRVPAEEPTHEDDTVTGKESVRV